jgi:hypothetical protein
LRALHGAAAAAGTTIVAAERVSFKRRFREKQFCFLQQSDCVAEKMKTIDFILDGKFHLHTKKKKGLGPQVKSR